MTLSIVIVSYNARRHLETCLQSIASAPPAIPHDVIVVDNASTDDSVAAARACRPPVAVIVQQANSGFAAANNVGIRATRGDLVLLLNSDTIVPPGAIDTLASRLLAHPDAVVAGPRLVDAEGIAELSFGPMISPLAELRQKLLVALHGRRVAPVSRWVERATRRERYVDWVSGACLLVHRAAADDAGLLDERFFLYTEDVDFCAAIRSRGHRVLFAPAAEFVHLRGQSRASAPTAANDHYRRSHLAFYEKHHPRWVPLLRMYLRLKGDTIHPFENRD
jgi:GT2 family glycosyltransferase